MYISVSFFMDCNPQVEAVIKTSWERFHILFTFERFDEKMCQRVFFPDWVFYTRVGLEDHEEEILL